MKHHFYMRILSQSDAGQVSELRARSYQRAQGMEVSAESLYWNPSDDSSLVLGVYDQSSLVATMRLEKIGNKEILEAKIEAPWPGQMDHNFPLGLLSRAATDERYAACG